VPFTVSASPAPLTFTLSASLKNVLFGSVGLIVSVSSYVFTQEIPKSSTLNFFFVLGSVTALNALIRRERIEIYPDSLRFRKIYFGIPMTKSILVDEVLGLEWVEGNEEGKNRSPSYLEFYTTQGSIKAGYSLTFEEYERFRGEVRMLYPHLDIRWDEARVRSKDFTLLNLQ
jgi:hypothetical protein